MSKGIPFFYQVVYFWGEGRIVVFSKPSGNVEVGGFCDYFYEGINGGVESFSVSYVGLGKVVFYVICEFVPVCLIIVCVDYGCVFLFFNRVVYYNRKVI